MKTRWLYLPVEIKARELDGKLLLAVEALRRGFQVVIGPKKIGALLPRLPRGAMLFKSAIPVNEYLPEFQRASAAGHRVLVHDEEGLLYLSEDHYRTRLPAQCLRFVDGFFCWGGRQAEIVEQEKAAEGFGFPVVVTGHPRIDLMRSPLNDFYAGAETVEREDEAGLLLVNTNFQACNHVSGWRQCFEDQKACGFHPDAASQRFRLHYVRHERRLLRRYVEMIEALAAAFPTHCIIVRPHPSENADTWHQRVGGLANVTVTRRESIGYWLRRAAAVIHTGCTTGIEALAMKEEPPISFQPIRSGAYNLQLPDDVSVSTRDAGEVVEAVRRNLVGRSTTERAATAREVLSRHLAALEGDYACTRMLDCIEQQTPAVQMSRTAVERLIGYHRLRAQVSDALRFGEEPKLLRGTRKFPFTPESEIQRKVAALARLLGCHELPGVTKIGMNTFVLFDRQSNFLDWLAYAPGTPDEAVSAD